MIEKSMREPCYPFAETTEILGIPETKLRQWQAAIPIFFMGEKARGRIWFTGLEVFVLAIMRDLVATGYTPHAAMITAFRTAGGPMLRKPRDGEFALVGSEGDAEFIDRRGEFAELGGVRRTGILIPLRAIWDEISAKCEARYES